MYIDFMSSLHNKTKRDYLGRVNEFPKAEAAKIAKKWGYDYWDGDRKFGYGGMKYDGRWRPVAETIAEHYNLKSEDKVLDVGCGKGFLLYELTQVVPGIEICGVDISEYAIEHAKEEVKPFLRCECASYLPFKDKEFDLVLSINTLHNLYLPGLWEALIEIERVGKQKYICVESYRNEEEKVNLLYWQITAMSIFEKRDWEWLFEKVGFVGDFSFIYFS